MTAGPTNYVCKNGHINPPRLERGKCGLCRKVYQKRVREKAKTWRSLYAKAWRYKTTPTEIAALLEEHPVCDVCGSPERVVDHCHDTGRIRGVLCNDCNLGIGRFKNRPDLLLRAVAYLA